MKKTALLLLLIGQLFTKHANASELITSKGPVVDFASHHRYLIGAGVITFIVAYMIHYGLDRLPKEEENEEKYERVLEAIKNRTATLEDFIWFLRVHVFPGSKRDLLDRITTTTKDDGTKEEIKDKFVRRKGLGWPAWFERRVLDHVEKISKPIIALCGLLYILNNALKDGSLPGNGK